MKSEFPLKSRDFACKGLTKVVSHGALNHKNQFDLRYTIVKIFVFGVKIAID